MKHLLLPFLLALSCHVAASFAAEPLEPAPLPAASHEKLPHWKGFNLLEKFMVHANSPFVEEDFRLIRELGFNFVRLPMDYRCWIKDGDWEKFDEKTLAEIDRAVEYGKKYDIHVMLNFHRAPGYTVAQPPEKTSLWTDAETQRVCAKHWAMFAKRYKGIPNERLSFNLFNEPANVETEVYVKATRVVIDAIRKEDPDRLIVSDALDWGNKPFGEAKELRIALATRGYAPFQLTHYKAGWVPASETWPVPTWPEQTANGLIFGSFKKERQAPLVIYGPFPRERYFGFKVHQVSTKAVLSVKADGKTIFEHDFKPGPGEGEWKTVIHKPEWNCYQNIYDKSYSTTIPAGTKKVEITVGEGDWLTLSRLEFDGSAAYSESCSFDLTTDWSAPTGKLKYYGEKNELTGGSMKDRARLKRENVDPWVAIEKTGVGVMVGEFGSYNKTPHDVTLRWMEDCLANWKEAGWGWALWNFRGSFGILDSERADVQYEDFHGHKLDRQMLELLQRY